MREPLRAEVLNVDGREVEIENPGLLIWPDRGIAKADYIRYLIGVAPYMLPYTRDRMLMIWRYPGGISGKRIEERSVHGTAPEWVPRVVYNGKERILLNDRATLVWAANSGALEFHVPFDRHYRKDYPTELVFDLDPAEGMDYGIVLETALRLREVLDGLSLRSFPKTSGATGLQVYVPIEPAYPFEETRKINRFVAEYLHERLPRVITLERRTDKRNGLLYLDYLQLWRGRTMAAPYSVRARPQATVSAPVTWEEVSRGFLPTDFTMADMPDRLARAGDLFGPVSSAENRLNQKLDAVLNFLRGR